MAGGEGAEAQMRASRRKRRRRQRPGLLERHRTVLLGLFVLGACAVTLVPGRPMWRNGIAWEDPGPGLKFNRLAQALSDAPLVSHTGSFSVEIFLGPGFIPGARNQEILSFYDGESVRPLLIGQFPRGFLLRGRADNPAGDPRRDAYIGIDEVGLARPADLRHLAVVVTGDGARLFVNGFPTDLRLHATIARPNEPFGGHLMLGSSYTGWVYWRGSMRGVAIYDRQLSSVELQRHALQPEVLYEDRFARDEKLLALYRFEEGAGRRAKSSVAGAPDLRFPERMERPTRSNFLSLHSIEAYHRGWQARDMVLNVLFFIPLGVLIAWRRETRAIGLALAAGFAFSLGIEVVQSFVPGRSSSLVDLATNSTGALIGALLTRLRGVDQSPH